MTENEKHTEHPKAESSHAGEEHVAVTHVPKRTEDNETFKIKKIQVWQGATLLFGVLLVISVMTGGFGFGNDTPAAPSPSGNAGANDPQPTVVNLEVGDAPVQGGEDAPVTIIEFSDFQCPFCSRFYTDTKLQLDKEYIETGKVRFAYKHFPLDSIHPQATPAALASECAREQGKFWEMHDIIFQNQNALGDASYKQWANQLALDTAKFNECYDTQKYLARIRSDLQEGSAAGIRGTPGFFVNGQMISGAQPYAVFKQIIDAQLAN